MQTMYPAKVNSPITTLSVGIDADDTTISIVDASVLPVAPNLCTIGVDEDAETILYTEINGNNLTVTRAFQGIAKNWSVGTQIGRMFTAYDYNSLKENYENHITSNAPHIFGNKYKIQYNPETNALEIWKMG